MPPEHLLHAINGMLVGLASSASSRGPTGDCIGMGFVRGIDVREGAVYVLTPLAPDAMRCADTLLVGCVHTRGHSRHGGPAPARARGADAAGPRFGARTRRELTLPLELLHSSSLPYRYLAPHCLGAEHTGAGAVKNRMNSNVARLAL